ncbi:MAG: alpha-galactosidase [Bacteroidales bacterium]|nr:alpha-galactosidase [Bacteroidales bacterium]
MTALLTLLASLVALHTANTSMVFDAPQGGELQTVYYGTRLSEAELDMAGSYARVRTYPCYGIIGMEEAAFSAIQPDGNRTVQLAIQSVSLTPWEGGQLLEVLCHDTVYPLSVKICFKSFTGQDMIETWTETVNGGKKPVTLTRFDSGHLPIRVDDVWISTLYGAWANEARVNTEPLSRGWKVIKNVDGARNSQASHGEVMISLDGKPREDSGRIIGASLCWGGNYELRFQTNESDYHHFFAGILPEHDFVTLTKGQSFATPHLALTYSNEGLSGASRNFHRWGRKYRLQHGDRERDILLNSWEGVYFDINEAGMVQMMDDIASMGGELFVMDDGWFGDKYPRNNDHTSLGDWMVDTRKLPGGVAPLVQAATERGIKFGIWIEPEMTNTVSELYEAHPDWIIKSAGREIIQGRGGTQVVLDMSRKEVQDFAFGIVEGIMKENPGIKYIKWDSNANIAMDGTSNIAYWQGFAAVCDRVRAAYPDLVIQDCASGGGRVNWGVLPWFDEFWTSDNTDALQRIFMQWGTSYFFPAIAMACHISATPNHTVFRTTSLKYRIDVAMSGRLGMEIQPANMTAEEKDMCRKAIAEYKRIRPIVQFGDLYRLVSPYDDKGYASLMYTTPERDKAVAYWWKIRNFHDEHLPRLRCNGLDPEKQYRVTELNRIDLQPLSYEGKVFSGRFLMESGLEIPLTNECEHHKKTDWSSRVLLLEAQ